MEIKRSDLHKSFREEMASWKIVPHSSTDDTAKKISLENCWVVQFILAFSLNYLQPSFLYSLKWKSPSNKEYFTMSNIWICCVCWSLSPLHGASSGWGWRNGLLYEGQLRIYWISSRGQLKCGGPPVWGLGEVLTIPPSEEQNVTEY